MSECQDLHKSDEQLISRYLLGEASDEDSEHLKRCPSCRLEAERSERVLLAFRGSIRELSSREMPASFQVASPPGWSSWTPARWSVAVIILLVIIGLRVSTQQHHGNTVDTNASSAVADGDAALLDCVRTDVARRVPSGMEPLLMLGSASGSAHDGHNAETLP